MDCVSPSWTGSDGRNHSKKIFCGVGDTSVVLRPVSSCRAGAIRCKNSIRICRDFRAVHSVLLISYSQLGEVNGLLVDWLCNDSQSLNAPGYVSRVLACD